MEEMTNCYTRKEALDKYKLFLRDLKNLPREKKYISNKHFCYVYNATDLEHCIDQKSNMTEEERNTYDNERNKMIQKRLWKLKFEIKKKNKKLKNMNRLRKKAGLKPFKKKQD
jgi:hypothetical protein